MRKINTFIGNIFVFLVSLLVSTIILELVLRVSPISDRLGWNGNLSVAYRASKLKKDAKVKIVVLGDSFVMWRAGTGVNMFNHVERHFCKRKISIVNLGEGGSNILNYIAVYENYVNLKPDGIIMCVFLGNDVQPYSGYPNLIFKNEEKGNIKDFWKRNSVLANASFRLAKKIFPFLHFGVFEHNLRLIQQDGGFSDFYIQERIKKIDPHIIKLAKADIINNWMVATGIALPLCYQYLFSLESEGSRIAADSTIRLIGEFYNKIDVKNFLVVLLPESIQVSTRYDDFYKRCGFSLDELPLYKRRLLTKYMGKRLNEMGIMNIDATDALEKEPSNTYIYI